MFPTAEETLCGDLRHQTLCGAPYLEGTALQKDMKKGRQAYYAEAARHMEADTTTQPTEAEGTPVTTMMLRNIPSKYTQIAIMEEIDALGFKGTYDFFYLPMDLHNRGNVGYAFINFVSPQAAERFRMSFTDYQFSSRKVCSVCVAHVQGFVANLRHLEKRAVTLARDHQKRPVAFWVNSHRALAQAKVAPVLAQNINTSNEQPGIGAPLHAEQRFEGYPNRPPARQQQAQPIGVEDRSWQGAHHPAMPPPGLKGFVNSASGEPPMVAYVQPQHVVPFPGSAAKKSLASPAPADPRQGLEGAIRDLLVLMQDKNERMSKSGAPSQAVPSLTAPPGLATPMPPPGLEVSPRYSTDSEASGPSSGSTSGGSTSSSEDNDIINELISLKHRLASVLAKKGGKAPSRDSIALYTQGFYNGLSSLA
jgi:hypothetical protein